MYYVLKNVDLQEEKMLIQKIKNQPQNFAVVYDQHFNRIFAYVIKRTLDYQIAKDISSEVFLKAFLSLQKFKWDGKPLIVWLYAIAQNEIRLFFRKKSYSPEYLTEHAAAWSGASIPSAEEERIQIENNLIKSEKIKSIVAALNQLNEIQRECVALHYLENFTHKEIAEILSLKVGTVKSHIHRGIKNLKIILQSKNNFNG